MWSIPFLFQKLVCPISGDENKILVGGWTTHLEKKSSSNWITSKFLVFKNYPNVSNIGHTSGNGFMFIMGHTDTSFWLGFLLETDMLLIHLHQLHAAEELCSFSFRVLITIDLAYGTMKRQWHESWILGIQALTLYLTGPKLAPTATTAYQKCWVWPRVSNHHCSTDYSLFFSRFDLREGFSWHRPNPQ